MDIEVPIEAVLQVMQQEFPREFTICTQRAYIVLLEKQLNEVQAQKGSPDAPAQ